MNGLPTVVPFDIYVRDNGNKFYNTRPDERPKKEVGDFLRSNEPAPDDEERWGK
jgi:hypothetical protein